VNSNVHLNLFKTEMKENEDFFFFFKKINKLFGGMF